MPHQPDPAASRYTVGSVAKALRLVELVAAGPIVGMTLSELSRGLGVSKSTAYALARTLVDAGHLRAVEPGPHYLLGMSLVRLGDIAGQRLPLSRLAAPLLQDLNQATGLTIRIAVVDDGYPVFVDRVDAAGTVRFHAPLGVRELPHTSSAGKAILASLTHADVVRIAAECGLPPRTRKSITDVDALIADLAISRRRGYAVDDEEDCDGVFCVAAAFFDHAMQCAGALSATGIKLDLPAWRLEELGLTVRQHADRLTAQLGGTAPTQEA
jgi:IclR family acetate operon transcriptional repressor